MSYFIEFVLENNILCNVHTKIFDEKKFGEGTYELGLFGFSFVCCCCSVMCPNYL